MHVEDIRDALERKDLRGMEGAFRALVGYPDEDDIVGEREGDLQLLLHRLCAALQQDDSAMPSETLDAINDLTGLMCGPTYGHGVRVVDREIDAFALLFGRASHR